MIDAVIRYHERTDCYICGRSIDQKAEVSWYPNGTTGGGRKTTIHFCQVCTICGDAEMHIADAKYEQVRYTPIGCGIEGASSSHGDRCICGAVTHASLGFCVACWKSHRMLNRAQAEARLISKALKELRKQIKTNQGAVAA